MRQEVEGVASAVGCQRSLSIMGRAGCSSEPSTYPELLSSLIHSHLERRVHREGEWLKSSCKRSRLSVYVPMHASPFAVDFAHRMERGGPVAWLLFDVRRRLRPCPRLCRADRCGNNGKIKRHDTPVLSRQHPKHAQGTAGRCCAASHPPTPPQIEKLWRAITKLVAKLISTQ